MFDRDSRYRFLDIFRETTPTRGAVRGTQLRTIPATPGTFLHSVHQGDRLDLLAYRYYGNGTAWWRICDANPQVPYPTDLVDTAPITREHFKLDAVRYWAWRQQLTSELERLGSTTWLGSTLFVASHAAELEPLGVLVSLGELQLPTRDCIIATYLDEPRATQSIRAAIAAAGLTLCDVQSSWLGSRHVTLWHCQDFELCDAWSALLNELAGSRGVTAVQAALASWAIEVTYNTAQTAREAIVSLMHTRGFEVLSSWTDVAEAKQLVIPPFKPLTRLP